MSAQPTDEPAQFSGYIQTLPGTAAVEQNMPIPREALQAMLGKAFSNQRELNHVLRPDWAEQGWLYYRAIWREAAEVMDHTNWEWWKNGTYGQPLDNNQHIQVCIELCDILHFGLSLDIINWIKGGRSEEQRIADYHDAFTRRYTSEEELESAIEGLMVDAILLREFNVKKFARACLAIGLDLAGLLAFYFGKSTLNHFRWANGYNNPEAGKRYIKMWKLPDWNTRMEDNMFLGQNIWLMLQGSTAQDVLDAINDGSFQRVLTEKLQRAYDTIELPS